MLRLRCELCGPVLTAGPLRTHRPELSEIASEDSGGDDFVTYMAKAIEKATLEEAAEVDDEEEEA
jgi:hypothetical protein